MRLTELTPYRFRNLSPDSVPFGNGMTVVSGDNAQGKTNLLEAVALVCGQRSFRRARPADMAAEAGGFALAATLRRGFETEPLRVEWSPQGGRRFYRAEKEVSFREASRLSPAVFLAPEHREIVVGTAGLRRRFLDRLVLGCRPTAGDDLARFDRVLRSRNALLSRSKLGGAVDEEELAAWTEELAIAGTAVRRHRRLALSEWSVFFNDLCQAAGREYAAISVSYVSDGGSEEDLRAACGKLAAVERRRGHSLVGPQRDELAWSRHGRPLSGCASSGEIHRTVALAKLAEWRTVKSVTGEPPLLGVDDFDAGLSSRWAEAFFDALPEGASVLLTTASEPSRWRRWASTVLEMREGRAQRSPDGDQRAVNDGAR